MPIAFVISNAEQAVVESVPPNDDGFPYMDGSLFHFRRIDIPGYLTTLQSFMKKQVSGSEEFRAALRLCERLGTWTGQKIAQAKAAAPAPVSEPVAEEQPVPKKRKTINLFTAEGSEANRTRH